MVRMASPERIVDVDYCRYSAPGTLPLCASHRDLRVNGNRPLVSISTPCFTVYNACTRASINLPH